MSADKTSEAPDKTSEAPEKMMDDGITELLTNVVTQLQTVQGKTGGVTVTRDVMSFPARLEN